MLTPVESNVIRAINQEEFCGFSFINSDFGKMYQLGYGDGVTCGREEQSDSSETVLDTSSNNSAVAGGGCEGQGQSLPPLSPKPSPSPVTARNATSLAPPSPHSPKQPSPSSSPTVTTALL